MADWPYSTAQWQRLRLAHLSRFPLCEGCEAMGRLTAANTVDHRVPISDGGDAFPGHDGLASYSPACHGAKTARGVEAGAIRSTKPRKGCDADGNPLDATHPWANRITFDHIVMCYSGEEIAQGWPTGTDPRPTQSVSLVNTRAITTSETANMRGMITSKCDAKDHRHGR